MISPPRGEQSRASQALERELHDHLQTHSLGHRVHVLDSIDSTMTFARSLHEQGEGERTVVVALEQTGGQGRRGRPFVSPRGGLYMTLLATPPEDVAVAWRYGFAAALAVRSVVEDLGGPEILFDWPNDLVAGERKVGGILLDLRLPQNQAPMVLLGIGLNLGPDPGQVDPGRAGPAGPLLIPRGGDPRVEVAAGVLISLEKLLVACCGTAGWQDVLQSVRRSSLAGRGGPVTVRQPDGRIVKGVGLGLGEDGSLLMRLDDGSEVSVRYGERVLL